MKKGLRFAFTDKKGTDWYEMIKMPCPICGHQGHCTISGDGKQVVCTRESTYNGKKGIELPDHTSYKFFLEKTSDLTDWKKLHHKNVKTNESRDNFQLNYVYRCLLEHAKIGDGVLNESSFKDLKRRGLSDETIERKGFTSLQRLNLSAVVEDDGHIDPNHFHTNYGKWFFDSLISEDGWKGTPGFYEWKHKEYTDEKHQKTVEKSDMIFGMPQVAHSVTGFSCIPNQSGCPLICTNDDYVVPAVDIDNNIFGMQVRHLSKDAPAKYTWITSSKNNEGTKAKMGVNVALTPELDVKRDTVEVKNWLHHGKKTVILTEGVLKSTVAAEHLAKVYTKKQRKSIGNVVLGNAGVSQWKQFLPVLKQLNAVNVIVAYDMDYKGKKEVEQSRKALINSLLKSGYNVAVASWDDKYKGIDDALQNNCKLTLKMQTKYQK